MKLNYRNLGRVFLLLVLLVVLFPGAELLAQCPMCRIGAETNLATGGSEGKGLNKGILFLLSLPYLLVGTIGYVWWKNNRKSVTKDA